jgi:Tol biopolymer transport system component
VNPDGSHFLPFKNPDRALNLACTGWSPDGRRLACGVWAWSKADQTRNGIYTVRATDGRDLIRVTNPGGALDGPGDYSPDGRQIEFLRTITFDDELGTLMVVNLDGSNAHALTDQKVGLDNRWSPDGLAILTDLGGSLRLVPIDGGPISPIKIDANPPITASRAAWSPDGNWIVFTGIQSKAAGEDLYIVRKDGTNLHQITNTPGVDEEFGAWGVAAP